MSVNFKEMYDKDPESVKGKCFQITDTFAKAFPYLPKEARFLLLASTTGYTVTFHVLDIFKMALGGVSALVAVCKDTALEHLVEETPQAKQAKSLRTLKEMLDSGEPILGKTFEVNEKFRAFSPVYFKGCKYIKACKGSGSGSSATFLMLDGGKKYILGSLGNPIKCHIDSESPYGEQAFLVDDYAPDFAMKSITKLSTKEIQQKNDTRTTCCQCGNTLEDRLMLNMTFKYCNACKA